jgi:hypothetical protein
MLRHDAFDAEPAGVGEDRRPAALKVLREVHPGRSLGQRITSASKARLCSLSKIARPCPSHHAASPSIVADAVRRPATASLMRG